MVKIQNEIVDKQKRKTIFRGIFSNNFPCDLTNLILVNIIRKKNKRR